MLSSFHFDDGEGLRKLVTLIMLGVHELPQMKDLGQTSLRGCLAMLAAFVLTIPLKII